MEYLACRYPGFFSIVLLFAAGGFLYLIQVPENAEVGGGVRGFVWVLVGALVLGAVIFGWIAWRRRRDGVEK